MCGRAHYRNMNRVALASLAMFAPLCMANTAKAKEAGIMLEAQTYNLDVTTSTLRPLGWSSNNQILSTPARFAVATPVDITAWSGYVRYPDGEATSLTVRRISASTPHESSPRSERAPWFSDTVDFAYKHDWKAVHSHTPSGLEVALTPHTGVSYSDGSANAEAGATLRIGQNLRDLAQDGDVAFGDRPRWYLFAAGTKRAVGYNLARTRDGAFSHAGLSHDRGSSLGDATIGVAYRRGAIETSVGLVYRENETKGLRGYEGLKTDVDEGILAFQFTIRPR